jgi:hypothetical protein
MASLLNYCEMFVFYILGVIEPWRYRGHGDLAIDVGPLGAEAC